MLTLYGVEGSRSIRISWLLEELKIPYEFVLFPPTDYTKGTYSEGLKKINPLGEVPALKLDDGTVLTESGFIVEYLMDNHGSGSQVCGRSESERLEIKQALFTAEGNLMTAAIGLFTHKAVALQAPPGISFILIKLFEYIDSFYATPKVTALLKQLEVRVAQNGGFYVGAHLTAADIMYFWDLDFCFGNKGFLEVARYPQLGLYIDRLRDEPGYKRASMKHTESHVTLD